MLHVLYNAYVCPRSGLAVPLVSVFVKLTYPPCRPANKEYTKQKHPHPPLVLLVFSLSLTSFLYLPASLSLYQHWSVETDTFLVSGGSGGNL